MNLQIQQSIRMLTDALFILMQKEKYKDITITQICQYADVSRRTFYRHFSFKDDIINLYIQELAQKYINCFLVEEDLSLQNVSYVYFLFWNEHKEFLTVIYKNQMIYLLLEKFDLYIPTIYEKYKINLSEYRNPQTLSYVLSFSAGGFFNMLTQWIERNFIDSPRELSNMINEMLNVNCPYHII